MKRRGPDTPEALRAALEAKDEFLAVVAHELRNPLGAILGWAHMLRRHASGEDFERGLDVIEQSAQAQARLVDELLDMARITSGKARLEMRAVEASALIDAALASVLPAAAEKRIR